MAMMSEASSKVLGPEEQPKSAKPKLPLMFVEVQKSLIASAIMGFAVDIIFFCPKSNEYQDIEEVRMLVM